MRDVPQASVYYTGLTEIRRNPLASTEHSLKSHLRLPLIAAPMFLVSGPELVIASCRAGVIGKFKEIKKRRREEGEEGLIDIEAALNVSREQGLTPASYGVNLIVHEYNPRPQADL